MLPCEFYDTLGAIQESIGQTASAEQSYLDGLEEISRASDAQLPLRKDDRQRPQPLSPEGARIPYLQERPSRKGRSDIEPADRRGGDQAGGEGLDRVERAATHLSRLMLHGSPVLIKPGDEIPRISFRFGVEFQGVMSLGIIDHLLVGRGQPFEEGQRQFIIDDPIPARLHQEGRLADSRGVRATIRSIKTLAASSPAVASRRPSGSAR